MEEASHLLIAVIGPTGTGKTDLALALAEEFEGEIINCDSVQLYRFMNIGSAKTPPEQRRGVPHHLVDVLNPDEHFTAGDYARRARVALDEIRERGKVPIVIGGTGFYLRALFHGLFEGPVRDVELRERLGRRSGARLHRLLARFDPASAARIHRNDKNKLIRTLEVILLERKPLGSLWVEKKPKPLEGFSVFKIGLEPPREQLNQRLDERCRHMFEMGLVDEVRQILEMGFAADSKALGSIGYKQAVAMLRGKFTLEQAIADTQRATRQYAKRQRTWFQREPGVLWIPRFGLETETLETSKKLLRGPITTMKRIILSFATVALAVASAATHKITLYQSSIVNGTELKPGQYKLEVKNNKAILTSGRTQVEADVTTQTAETKFATTSVRFANGDGKMKVTEIRLGGTNTKLVFEN